MLDMYIPQYQASWPHTVSSVHASLHLGAGSIPAMEVHHPSMPLWGGGCTVAGLHGGVAVGWIMFSPPQITSLMPYYIHAEEHSHDIEMVGLCISVEYLFLAFLFEILSQFGVNRLVHFLQPNLLLRGSWSSDWGP